MHGVLKQTPALTGQVTQRQSLGGREGNGYNLYLYNFVL